MSNSNDQLTELEIRITALMRKYSEQKKALARKTEECEALLRQRGEQAEKINLLEQNLCIATISGGATSPEARAALEGLEAELSQIMGVIDECITLLDGRIE